MTDSDSDRRLEIDLASWLTDPKTHEIIARNEPALLPAEGNVYGPEDLLEDPDGYWEFAVRDKTAPPTKTSTGKRGPGDIELLYGQGNLKEVVTYQTAQEYLNVTRRQIERLVKKNHLEAQGVGLHRRITTASLRRYRPENAPLKEKAT